MPSTEEELTTEWFRGADCLELEGGTLESDLILRSLLGRLVVSSFAFRHFLEAVPKGDSFGDEGAWVMLPAGIVMSSVEEGWLETGFFVTVSRTGFGDRLSEVSRMPVSRFLFHAALATAFHARHVNHEIDLWATLQRISKACTRPAQLAKLPGTIAEQMCAMRTEWVSPSASSAGLPQN